MGDKVLIKKKYLDDLVTNLKEANASSDSKSLDVKNVYDIPAAISQYNKKCEPIKIRFIEPLYYKQRYDTDLSRSVLTDGKHGYRLKITIDGISNRMIKDSNIIEYHNEVLYSDSDIDQNKTLAKNHREDIVIFNKNVENEYHIKIEPEITSQVEEKKPDPNDSGGSTIGGDVGEENPDEVDDRSVRESTVSGTTPNEPPCFIVLKITIKNIDGTIGSKFYTINDHINHYENKNIIDAYNKPINLILKNGQDMTIEFVFIKKNKFLKYEDYKLNKPSLFNEYFMANKENLKSINDFIEQIRYRYKVSPPDSNPGNPPIDNPEDLYNIVTEPTHIDDSPGVITAGPHHVNKFFDRSSNIQYYDKSLYIDSVPDKNDTDEYKRIKLFNDKELLGVLFVLSRSILIEKINNTELNDFISIIIKNENSNVGIVDIIYEYINKFINNNFNMITSLNNISVYNSLIRKNFILNSSDESIVKDATKLLNNINHPNDCSISIISNFPNLSIADEMFANIDCKVNLDTNMYNVTSAKSMFNNAKIHIDKNHKFIIPKMPILTDATCMFYNTEFIFDNGTTNVNAYDVTSDVWNENYNEFTFVRNANYMFCNMKFINDKSSSSDMVEYGTKNYHRFGKFFKFTYCQYMNHMFDSISVIHPSKDPVFNLNTVYPMETNYMFANYQYDKLVIPTEFNIYTVNSCEGMFYNANKLATLVLSLDTSKFKGMKIFKFNLEKWLEVLPNNVKIRLQITSGSLSSEDSDKLNELVNTYHDRFEIYR